jgi:hypothetical protein
MIWFGLPLGAFASLCLVVGVVQRLRSAADAPSLAVALALLTLLVHSLVEFPLHYSFFFLPFGLLLGATHAPCRFPRFCIPLRGSVLLPALALSFGTLLAFIARDYIRLSDVRPAMEIDLQSRYLVLAAGSPAPKVHTLDQLQAFHSFAAASLTSRLSAKELEALRAPMTRMPYPQAIERYAHLMAVNGRHTEANEALERVCKFQDPISCSNSKKAWSTWRLQGEDLPKWLEARDESE